jgi:lipopolysaccharide/colanic/teichoic acid biosynthesis glycosyltransferase
MAIFRTSVETADGVLTAVSAPPASELPVPFASWAVREYRLKRVIDVLFSGLALAVSAPVWLGIALAIKLEDRGPVFFTQLRWGRGQRPFRVYKFRSMTVTADSRVQALRDDQRITRVGRVLRATSLDELPQVLNIWRGDMSWVGPRALPINEKQQNETDAIPDSAVPGFALRCAVRPGLTGIAQIFAPRDVPRRQKFRYDAFYIQRQSAWLDLRLIAISVWISLRLRWEDRGPKVAWLRRGRRRRGDVR